ncbi:DUF2147 domain-containing protein [Bradyrhizobium sp. 2S1]|uniref:DUF2147 domain-containing protein n=1 Tax=Bradyrhizobium sp. 2S1 TaxID=1404429 RepID=UPI00140B065F|nr:DUF2147 domain-containing protein [Bradyrhizobium sp. 2S1]MCK7670030.1 DUF2147 domain-containing protein [Bradyrhizobium sp. 2S1]
MRKLLAIATLLLAGTAAAQAQYTFDYDGRTIRIDPDRGTVSIPGVYDNTPRRTKRAKGEDTGQKRKPASTEAKTDAKTAPTTNPQPAPGAPPAAAAAAPAAVDQATARAAPTPATPTAPASTSVAATPPPAAAATAPPPPAPPVVQQSAAPATRPATAPTVGAVVQPPAAPKPASNPLGVWLTEEKEGKVRIEQCGANLCGYAVDKKSNVNGEQILINMKPGKDKWSGRIFDPSSGSTYDSTIAMKSSDTLRVQGCAFGGMFCGGQTWTRVN